MSRPKDALAYSHRQGDESQCTEEAPVWLAFCMSAQMNFGTVVTGLIVSTNCGMRNVSRTFLALLFLLVSNGCASLSKPLPPVNLQEPGWKVRQGQAVWKLPTKGGNDIAGEVLVATGPDNRTFVQFTKTPFPILLGQTSANHWQVELPPQNKRYGGPGLPPKRLIWLYLPRAMEGKSLPPQWQWTNSETDWRLQNQKTGESIEGYFTQ